MPEVLKVSNNTAKLHQVMGKKLYSDRYSFICEMCQNAVDSHRRAGQTDPVEVGIRKEKDEYFFYVLDHGTSFEDIEDFKAKIGVLLESDKSYDKTNDESCEMGAHGIGSIAASAYHPEWKYIVVKDFRRFTVLMKEEEGVGITMDASEYETDYEEKYVRVEIKVPSSGLVDFINNMLRKLAYFKDILFKFPLSLSEKHKQLLTLNTDFQLMQSDDFQISTLNQYKEMHICIDQYAYPIKWQHLGIRPIPLGVALRFGLADGLEPDLTRENVQITETYKDVIMAKIEKVATWFVDRYNQSIKDEYDNLTEYVEVFKAVKSVIIFDKHYPIDELVQYASIKEKPLKFKDADDDTIGKFIQMTDVGRKLFERTHDIVGGKRLSRDFSPGVVDNPHGRFLVKTSRLKKSVIDYLKDTREGCSLYGKRKIPLKAKKGDVWSYNNFMNLFHGKAHMAQLYKSAGINIWRERIKQFQYLEGLAEKEYFTIIDDAFKIPEDYKPKRAAVKRRNLKLDVKKLEGDVVLKCAEPTTISSTYNCKFTEKLVKVSDLYKQPYLHVYGTEEQRQQLDLLWCLTSSVKSRNHHVVPTMLTKTQLEHIRQLNLHNFMDVKDFLEGKHKELRKIMTAHFIRTELLTPYRKMFSYRKIIKEFLCSGFAEDMKTLEKYADAYYYQRIDCMHDNNVKALEKLARELKLYDLTMWTVFQRVKKEADKFDFLEYFTDPLLSGNPEKEKKATRALQDLARQRKIKMNWEYYQLFDFEKAIEELKK